MASFPPLLRFRHLKDKTIRRGNMPALHLGIQYYHIPESRIPLDLRNTTDFCAFRVAPTFGSDGFNIRKAHAELTFNKVLNASAHDYFPRKNIEQMDASPLEVGLNVDLTWILPIRVGLKYRTTLRRIRTVLSPGGLLSRTVTWKFRRRFGERRLVGATELLLMMQVPKGKVLRGRAWIEAELGLVWHKPLRLGFRFDVPPRP